MKTINILIPLILLIILVFIISQLIRYSYYTKTPFYVCIVTMKSYSKALEVLLQSLPKEYNYILVYGGQENENYSVLSDHIEVNIKQNIYEYNSWIGVHTLIKNKVVPDNAWFLFIHDTSKFLNDSNTKINNILDTYDNTNLDIVWLSSTGQCNICLIRKNGIEYGYNLYKDINNMTKMDAIKYEHHFDEVLSPKNFKVNQEFIQIPTKHMGKRDVYENNNLRDVLLYDSINMEKYYNHILKEEENKKIL